MIRFAVAIPAHNEASVIRSTIASILTINYPKDLYDIYIVADHCQDETAGEARAAGALVFERNDGTRGGKGEALTWLFSKIFSTGQNYAAVVIFDADTKVHPDFFKVMSRRIQAGAVVVQGNHIIRNPQAGWFPALTWAMFLIDNRCQNMGRAKLGLSAKNMGDSICFRADILQKQGWGSGLTEDFAFRQKLLFEGIRIDFDPEAKGYGDAAINLQEAGVQRARWLRGSYLSSRQTAKDMLLEGFKRRNLPLLDGAVQAYLPSYSTLTLLAGAMTLVSWMIGPWIWGGIFAAWLGIFTALFIYPLFGLALDRAPLKAYLAILAGPIFIVWRTWLALSSRFISKDVKWVRTPRHVGKG